MGCNRSRICCLKRNPRRQKNKKKSEISLNFPHVPAVLRNRIGFFFMCVMCTSLWTNGPVATAFVRKLPSERQLWALLTLYDLRWFHASLSLKRPAPSLPLPTPGRFCRCCCALFHVCLCFIRYMSFEFNFRQIELWIVCFQPLKHNLSTPENGNFLL